MVARGGLLRSSIQFQFCGFLRWWVFEAAAFRCLGFRVQCAVILLFCRVRVLVVVQWTYPNVFLFRSQNSVILLLFFFVIIFPFLQWECMYLEIYRTWLPFNPKKLLIEMLYVSHRDFAQADCIIYITEEKGKKEKKRILCLFSLIVSIW